MAKHGKNGNTRRNNVSTSLNKFVGEYIDNGSHRFTSVADFASNAFWSAYTTLEENYQMVCLILAVTILSVQLPTLAPKLQVIDQMHEIKSALNIMSNEVNQAGELCKQMANEVYLLYCNVTKPGLEDKPHDVPEKINRLYLKKQEGQQVQ